MDESAIREKLGRYFEHVGADVDRAEELYHEDAVLEFPQSGERFEGRAGFTEWRAKYPAPRESMRFHIRRMVVREDFSVVELSASYDAGENWVQGVQLAEWREGKMARERIYVTEGWEAPEWRTPWRSATPADPTP